MSRSLIGLKEEFVTIVVCSRKSNKRKQQSLLNRIPETSFADCFGLGDIKRTIKQMYKNIVLMNFT